MKIDSWQQKVSRVFNTEPRDGSDERVLWLKRPELEEDISNTLLIPQKHICIDGATGTGKSSLVITCLKRLRIKSQSIQLVTGMSWKDVCRRILNLVPQKESNFSAEMQAGISNALPQANVKLSLGKKIDKFQELNQIEKMLEMATEYDICEIMATNNITLVIDDFEKATDDIVSKVANMAKLLIQTYQNDYAKIVLIGMDDIFRRLMAKDVSLDARIREITVDTLSHEKNETIAFLYKGFERLRISHAKSSEMRAADPNQKKQILESIREYVYKAANGLPKSLNELGQRICLKREGFSTISSGDIISECQKYMREEFNKWCTDFPALINCIKSNPVTYDIISHMYRNDIGKKHIWIDLSFRLTSEKNYSVEDINHGLNSLIKEKFLIRTGHDNEILFVRNPAMAHLLGVYVNFPEDLNQPRLKPGNQLELPFYPTK